MRLVVMLSLALMLSGCSYLASLPPELQSALQLTTTPTLSPTITATPASTAEAINAIRQDLLGRINRLRAEQKLPPYQLVPALVAAAQNQAEWLVTTGQVVHIHDGGSTPSKRAEAAGYPNPASVSENIYMGQIATQDHAWEFWITSPIHYAGLTSQWHDEIGIGTAHSDTFGQSFVLVFGASGKPWPTQPPITVTAPAPTASATAGPSPTPTATRQPQRYIVQAGDTLFSIATRNGTTVAALAAANGIVNPDVLEVGQQLVIP